MIADDPRWTRGRALRMEGVAVVRGGVEVLREVTLNLEPGRRYVLLGPSGAGKSTFLRLLNRLDEPSAGRMFLGETPLAEIPVRTLRRAVGLVFQAPRPLPGSVLAILLYPFHVRGWPVPEPAIFAARMQDVGLDPGWLDRDAAGLSGGERQKLAIAAALGIGPEILAMDEPTSALDPASAERIARLLADRGLRTVIACHHRGHAAMLGDEAIVLDRGAVVDRGPVAEVLGRIDGDRRGSPP